MIVSSIFAFGVVLILGLSYLGVRLAYKLNEQDKPRMLTQRQKNDMARIKSLLGKAEQEDRKATGCILDGYDVWARDATNAAAHFRKEAKKIAKESGIELVE